PCGGLDAGAGRTILRLPARGAGGPARGRHPGRDRARGDPSRIAEPAGRRGGSGRGADPDGEGDLHRVRHGRADGDARSARGVVRDQRAGWPRFEEALAMEYDVITIFPEIVEVPLTRTILKRAVDDRLITVRVHQLRDYADDPHRRVDDQPYGGGGGMVIKP